MRKLSKGHAAALLAPVFLGMAPFFGKLALEGGADPFTVASFRTALVALFLWGMYGLFWRKFTYIYPAGLMACMAIGFTNGIGSLFYYTGLDRLDASMAQILNATYLVFVILLTRIDGVRIGPWTVVRVTVALFGVLFITGGLSGQATWVGVGLMLGNALLFAGTVVMSQRVLYEMPPQTVTLYVMTAMALVVVLARLISDPSWTPLSVDATSAIIALAVSTALSRLLLFAGVKGIGSVGAALLAIAEGAVAVALAFVFLEERLTVIQWIGVAALAGSLLIPIDTGSGLPNIAGMRFSKIAFNRSFRDKLSTQEAESVNEILSKSHGKVTTQDMAALRGVLNEDTYRFLENSIQDEK